jgi:hypothetical protein
MPMTTQICLNPMGQEDFARLDYEVMRQAFASPNQLGRLPAAHYPVGEPGGRARSIGFADPIRQCQKNGVKKMS